MLFYSTQNQMREIFSDLFRRELAFRIIPFIYPVKRRKYGQYSKCFILPVKNILTHSFPDNFSKDGLVFSSHLFEFSQEGLAQITPVMEKNSRGIRIRCNYFYVRKNGFRQLLIRLLFLLNGFLDAIEKFIGHPEANFLQNAFLRIEVIIETG